MPKLITQKDKLNKFSFRKLYLSYKFIFSCNDFDSAIISLKI